MTEEQKKRIVLAKENDCNFDGMPVHPHHYRYLVKAGFKNITEIEALTEKEFCKRIDDAFSDHESNRGNRCLRNLKDNGVVFASEENDSVDMKINCGRTEEELKRLEEARVSMERKIAEYHNHCEVTSSTSENQLLICSRCGKENLPGALMCIKCGTSFDYKKEGAAISIRSIEEEERLSQARLSMEAKANQAHKRRGFIDEYRYLFPADLELDGHIYGVWIREYLYWATVIEKIRTDITEYCIKNVFERYVVSQPDSVELLDDLDVSNRYNDAIDKFFKKRYKKEPYIFLKKASERERKFERYSNNQLNAVAHFYGLRTEAYEEAYRAKQRLLETSPGGNFSIFMRDLPSFLFAQVLLGIQDYSKMKDIDKKGEKIFAQALKARQMTASTPEEAERKAVFGNIMPEAIAMIDECRNLALQDVMEELLGDSIEGNPLVDDSHIMNMEEFGITRALVESNNIIKSENVSEADLKKALLICPYNTKIYTELLHIGEYEPLIKKCAEYFEFKLVHEEGEVRFYKDL